MLEVSGLSCGYGSKFMLKNINCQIGSGQMVGIIGPNGSGKTTFLRAVTRVLKPESGQVLLEGRDIWQMRMRDFARKIAVVTQNLPQEDLSVEEFVLLGRIPHLARLQFFESQRDLAVAQRSMQLTDTLGLKQQRMDQISGGEKQLAHLARALAQEPQLLLLDEPTAHLDIRHQVSILDLVKRLNREFGLTVITVLHDLNLASLYCDRLILLNNGLIHRAGSPKEVLTYQIIEQVYRTVVVVRQDPLSQRPCVFLVPQGQREEGKMNCK